MSIKKILFLLGSIMSGYIGLAGVSFTMSSNTQNIPQNFLFMMGIIGAIGLFGARVLWKKFKLS